MSKYDIHKWKDGELNERLMEKWGYKRKLINEAEKTKLKNPDKADLDDDGELSSYEKKRGAAIEKSMGDDDSEDDDRTKVSEGENSDESDFGPGVPMVPAGDIEGIANAAIAAIVQLAAEAGVKLDVTSGDEALPDEGGEEMDMDDLGSAGAEAGEEELMDPEDL